MLLPSEFVLQWGTLNLFQCPSGLVDDIDIPKSAKVFLREAGVPILAETPLGISSAVLPVTLKGPLIPAAKHLLFSSSPFTEPNRLMLTRLIRDNSYWDETHSWNGDYPLYFAVEVGSGQVRVIGPPLHNVYEPEYIEDANDHFVNSSLLHLMEFFLAGRTFAGHFWFRWFYAHEQVPALIDALERQWQRIDPSAMASLENWWPKNVQSLRTLYWHALKISTAQLVL